MLCLKAIIYWYRKKQIHTQIDTHSRHTQTYTQTEIQIPIKNLMMMLIHQTM
jgi:hypothetical protein